MENSTSNYIGIGFTIGLAVFLILGITLIDRLPDFNPNLLTVKGLVEKTVKADLVVWNIHLKRVGGDVTTVNTALKNDKDIVLSFLKKNDIRVFETAELPIQFIDKFARDYTSDQDRNPAHRFAATTTIQVTSSEIDKIRKVYGLQDTLLEKGVLLDAEKENGQANPRYLLPTFNSMRPILLNEATANAQETAAKMIQGTNMKITEIHAADQGSIQILGEDGKDESDVLTAYSPVKKIRLVSTFKFKMVKKDK